MMSFSRNLTYLLLLSVVMLPLFVTYSKSSMDCALLQTLTNLIRSLVCVTLIPVLLTPLFAACRFPSHVLTHTLLRFGNTYPKPLLSLLPSKPSDLPSIPISCSQLCFWLFPGILFCSFCVFGMLLSFL